MVGWSRWCWGSVLVGFAALACGRSANETIVECAGAAGQAAESGSSGSGGNAGSSGTASERGGSTSQAGVSGSSEPPIGGNTFIESSSRCQDKPSILTAELPSCDLGDDLVLDDLAVSRSAIALDDDRVYYVGNPPAGVRCPNSEDCNSVLSVPKGGGEIRVHGSATFTGQIAVDDDFVYWDGTNLKFAPKQGGEMPPTYLSVGGVATAGGVLYAIEAASSFWGLVRVSLTPTGVAAPERIAELPDLSLVPKTLVTDGEWAYLVQFQTSPAQPLHAIRLRDGTQRVLAMIDVARGIAVGGHSIYVSEETSRSIVRVDLPDGTATALCLGSAIPTTLAADEHHLYLNAETLGPDSKYSGQLLRMAADGSDPCVVASGLEYSSAPVVDEQYVYWIGSRLLHKLPKE